MAFFTPIFPETAVKMADKGHRPAYMVPVIATPFIFALVCFFNAMAASSLGQQLGIFLNNTGDVARGLDTEVQPAGWTFSIWGVIYAWQAAWIVYALTTLCRQGADGYLYYSPPVMSPLMYTSYMLNNLLNIGWLLTWDRQILPLSVVMLAFMVVTLYLALFESLRALARYGGDLEDNDLTKDIWCIRILVQNGFGIYAGWVTVATLVNLSVTLVYSSGLTNETASTICFAILLAILLAWVALDTFLLDRFTRYLVTPHCVVIFALIGVVVKNYRPGATNSIFSVIILALAIAALASKVTLMIFRHIRSPVMKVDFTRDIPMVTVDDRKYRH